MSEPEENVGHTEETRIIERVFKEYLSGDKYSHLLQSLLTTLLDMLKTEESSLAIYSTLAKDATLTFLVDIFRSLGEEFKAAGLAGRRPTHFARAYLSEQLFFEGFMCAIDLLFQFEEVIHGLGERIMAGIEGGTGPVNKEDLN